MANTIGMFKRKKLPLVTAQETVAAGEGVVLIDVRERHEWEAGHARTAINAPLSELDMYLEALSVDRPIVCVCRSGKRSAEATARFRREGFSASSLDGGMAAWVTGGFGVVAAQGTPGRIL